MILIDANLLIYAYDSSSPFHDGAREWLEERLSAPEPVGFAWHPIVAFLRIMTNPRVFERPLTAAEAREIVDAWVERPNVVLLEPSSRHWEILDRVIEEGSVRGPLMTDAHIAALALGNGATLCTTDGDFARFPGLDTWNPLRPRGGGSGAGRDGLDLDDPHPEE